MYICLLNWWRVNTLTTELFFSDVENCDINIDTLTEKKKNIKMIRLAAFKSCTFERLSRSKKKKKMV